MANYNIAYFHNAENSGVMTAEIGGSPGRVKLASPNPAGVTHRWRLQRANTGPGVTPWWRIRVSDPGIDLYLTASGQATPCRHNGATFDCHALELLPPATGPSDSRRQQWFFESYPNTFDQSAPLFGNGVRIWNRETRSVICFDPPYASSFLFSRVNANEGRHSHWFVSMVP